MAGSVSTGIKRKEFEGIYDEFSELSLLPLPRKSRRLDVDLPPIMEEDEVAAHLAFGQQLSHDQVIARTNCVPGLASPNEERAIVLYKLVENPLLLSPCQPDVSFKVSVDLIHQLKNQAFKSEEQSAFRMDVNPAASDNCLALIPWLSSPRTASNVHALDGTEPLQNDLPQDQMETEEADASLMEVEEETDYTANNSLGGEGVHWQQYCMTPQPPSNSPSSIMWSQ